MNQLKTIFARIVERWVQLPSTYQNFVSLYAIMLPIGVLSIFITGLQVVYGIFFFLISAVTVFNPRSTVESPEHSTIEHYEHASRYNWWNYVMASFVAVSALLFVFLPINKALIAIICWTFACGFLLIYMPFIQLKLALDMLENYLHQQFPDIYRVTLRKFIQSKLFSAEVDLTELSAEQKDKLGDLTDKYIANNGLNA
jgi:hypothetical protein